MWIIICKRSIYSIFGAMEAPAKGRDGKFLFFETKEQAEAQANQWRSTLSTPNVSYRVTEWDLGWD